MQIIGHRGAKGLAPENTLAGIRHALDLGVVDWIEIDVRHSADGKLLVLHDAFTGRVAEKHRWVRASSSASLRVLPLKDGQFIPLLSEVMELAGGRARLNIELKTSLCSTPVAEAIASAVRQGHTYDEFLVSSFIPRALKAVHTLDPRIPLGLLQFPYLSAAYLPFVRTLGLRAVGFSKAGLSASSVARAKKSGLFTYAYTVNDEATLARMQRIGIEGVVTDYPDNIATLLGRHR